MERRAAAVILLVVISLPAFAGCAETLGLRDDDPEWNLDLSIGLLLPTPHQGAYGDLMPAAQLAVQQLNAADMGLRIRVHEEAYTDDPAAAFDRLVEKGVDAVVGPGRPGEAAAVVPRALATQTLLVMPAAVDGSLMTQDHGGYLMRVAVNEEMEAAAFDQFLQRERIDRLVVLHIDDAYGAGVANAFARRYDGDVVDVIPYNATRELGVKAAAASACDLDWDAALLLSHPVDAGWILRGLYEAGCRDDRRIYANANAHHPEMMDKAGRNTFDEPVAERVMGLEPANGDLLAFHALFETVYNRAPGPFAAEAYDAVHYIGLAAIRSQGAIGRELKDLDADITTEHLRTYIAYVASQPGAKQRDITLAAPTAKAGDNIDWRGFAHDFDFTQAQEPAIGPYKVWHVDHETGRFEYVEGYRVVPS